MTINRFFLPLLVGTFGIILAWLGTPVFIPDSYEQAIVAECWRYDTSSRMDCANIFPWFRPPLPSLLITPWIDWIDSFTAILLLSWLAVVSTVGIIVHRTLFYFHSESSSGWIALTLTLTLSLSGLITDLGLLADSKTIALPLVFGAGNLFLSHKQTLGKSIGAGILLGLAFLTRFENLLLIVSGFGLVLLISKRQRWHHLLAYGLGCVPFVGGWIWLLRETTGRWTLSPRYWEQWILLLIDEMPLRWVQELYGMGIWNPPLRTVALQSNLHQPSGGLLDAFELWEWLDWLNMNILSLFHPIVVLIFLGSLLLWIGEQSMRRWMCVLLWISLPSIAVTVLPQGRESIFPVAYVLPMWCAVWIWIGLSVGLLLVRIESLSKWIYLLGLIGVSQLPTSIQPPDNIALLPVSMTAQHWIRSYTPKNSIILSSFEIAPIVWLSERQWQEWHSPFEANLRIPNLQKEHPAIYGLVAEFDHHAWYSLSFEERYYEPVAYIHNGKSSFLLFDFSPVIEEQEAFAPFELEEFEMP